MKLNFIYDVDSELDRVRYSLHRKKFYIDNKYRLQLPAGFDLSTENLDLDALEKQIQNEIHSPNVITAKSDISSKWRKYSSEISKVISSLETEIPKEICIVLTKYGVGGSYCAPHKVIINVNCKNYFENFVHEFIHCCIDESIIQNLHVDHQRKEGIVDWIFLNSPILKTIFPTYKLQSRSILPTEDFIEITRLDSIK